ncbi:LuxR C-terminal-related transcriptional regulator [Actinoplanes sp. NPDC051494]|uniref:helix-turn-helix transcriptional regulator n=1 Tax=Actinoplanes sp. NPDC051494 TaxID=3363907 RepID=UPI0037971638
MTRTPVSLGAAIPSLVRWGLSSDADLVFRTLATFGPRTERALAAELGLPARRTTQALAELRESGAADATTDPRVTARIWTGRRPAVVVEHLRTRRMHRIDPEVKVRSHHAVVNTLRVAGIDIGTALAGDFADGVRYLASRGAARRRLGELVTSDLQEFWSMTTEQAIDVESARAASPMDVALQEQGVQCRLLRPPPADGDALDVSSHLVNGTSYQRYETTDVPLKMFIGSRRSVIFPADPADLERGYFEVRRPGVVDILVRLFERSWDTAVRQQRQCVAPIILSSREQSLIALLAAGHTDRAAADNLRISTRSVTGTLRSLMDRLGVENRFQLGLALGSLRAAAPPSLAAVKSDSAHGES